MKNAVQNSVQPSEVPIKQSPKVLNPILEFLKEQPVWIVVVGCLIFFSFLSPHFLTVQNLTNILLQSSIIGFMAIGMTYIMINGNIDLSVGATMALAAVLVIGLQPFGLVFAIVISLLAGMAVGALNGWFVTKVGINAFVVTLGAMIGVRGLVFVYTGEQSLVGENFTFADLGASYIGPLPLIVVIFLVTVFLGEWVLRNTPHGRNAFAVGGNYEAAVNAGIKVKKHILINFIVIGFAAALAGIVLASRMNAATPTLGMEYELWVITAVVLGGTKLTGGYGSVLRTFGGILIIGILRNGMNLLNVQAYYVLLIMGLILITVVFIDKRFGKVK